MPPKFQAAGSAVAAGILTLTWLHVTATPVFAHGDLHERIQALTQQLQTKEASPGALVKTGSQPVVRLVVASMTLVRPARVCTVN